MKNQLRMSFAKLYLFLLLFTINLLTSDLYALNIDDLEIKQTLKSGEQIKFVKIINNFKNGYYHRVAEKNFKYLDGKSVKWKNISGKKAVFLGKIRQNNKIYWLYKLTNGKLLISKVDDYWDNTI